MALGYQHGQPQRRRPPNDYTPQAIPGGDQANGGYGAQTDASQKNAEIQRNPSAGSNPAGAFANLGREWAALNTPQVTNFSAPMPTQPGQPYVPQPAQDRYLQSLMQSGTATIDGGGDAGSAPPWMKQPTAESFGDGIENRDPNDRGGTGGDTRGGTGGGPVTPPTPTPDPSRWDTRQTTGPVPPDPTGADDTDPVTGRRRIAGAPVPHPNPGIDPNAWATILRWSESPDFKGYERLLTDRAWSFPDYTEFAARQEAAGYGGGMDFVDWYAHRFGDSTGGDYAGVSPMFGRKGYDSYLYTEDANGNIVSRSDFRNQSGGGTPSDPAPSPQGEPPPLDPATVPPPAEGAPPPTGTAPPPVETSPPPVTGAPPPATTPPPDPATVPPPPSGPTLPDDSHFGPAPPPMTGQPSPQGGDLYGQLESLLAPGYQREHDQLTRTARAASAVGGGLADDSGGFGANLIDAHASLGADQGKRTSDYLHADSQSAQDRALQRYMSDKQTGLGYAQIDKEKAIAQLNADVQKLGIVTNADLEKGKLDFAKYGYDKDLVFKYYQEELNAKNLKYSTDAQINQAALNNAASRAIASSNNARAALSAEQERQYNLQRLAQQEKESQRQYDLGIFGLNQDTYKADQNDRYRYLYFQWLMSPEARQGGSFPLPGGQFIP